MYYLRQIQDTFNIRILYACESGSRAWGFASEDSDYDARFVYVMDLDSHIAQGIQKDRDVIDKEDIEFPYPYDINGWELSKFLTSMHKGNAIPLEWLKSPLVYFAQPVVADLKLLAEGCFNPSALLYHYGHSATKNRRQFLEGDSVSYKKYLYVIRPVMAMLWIVNYKTFPPINIDELFRGLDRFIVPQIQNHIYALIKEKRSGNEMLVGPPISIINDWIDTHLDILYPKWIAAKYEMVQADSTLVRNLYSTIVKKYAPERTYD